VNYDDGGAKNAENTTNLAQKIKLFIQKIGCQNSTKKFKFNIIKMILVRLHIGQTSDFAKPF